MTELSPAARAVILEYSKIAYDSEIELLFSPLPWEHKAIAAALRAARTELDPSKMIEDIDYVHQSYVSGYEDALDEILAIAIELEGDAP